MSVNRTFRTSVMVKRVAVQDEMAVNEEEAEEERKNDCQNGINQIYIYIYIYMYIYIYYVSPSFVRE